MTALVEYLFCWLSGSPSLHRFRVTRKTAKRTYFLLHDEQLDDTGAPCEVWVDRYKLKRLGETHIMVTDDDGRLQFVDLYVSYEAALNRYKSADNKPLLDLAALKQAMANAHPDRGGSNAAFIEARKRYVAACRLVRQ